MKGITCVDKYFFLIKIIKKILSSLRSQNKSLFLSGWQKDFC
jgi:hypothetical protein